MSELGTILPGSKFVGITSTIKSGTTVVTGLVYIDGVNCVKNAPVDASKVRKDLFWFDKSVVATADIKVTIFELEGLDVIGQADKAIVVNKECKASETAAHGGQLESATISTATVILNDTDRSQVVAVYRGHELEIKEGSTPTDAIDTETNCVFRMRGGA